MKVVKSAGGISPVGGVCTGGSSFASTTTGAQRESCRIQCSGNHGFPPPPGPSPADPSMNNTGNRLANGLRLSMVGAAALGRFRLRRGARR